MERPWEALAAAQAGLLSQQQLHDLEVSRGTIRHELRMRRWVQRTASVYSTTTGPLSWEQRLWAGVLHAGPSSLLGGLTAASVHGVRGWDRDAITVLVENPLSFEPLEGVEFFRTRRSLDRMRSPLALPVARLAPAVLLFAAHEDNQRTAQGAVAAVVQQRRATVSELRAWVERLRPLRRARLFRALLDDIEGGAQSLAEVDLRRACRRHGIAPPTSQRPRLDRRGRRRFTDAEWRLPDGRTLVLEVDGSFHDDVLEATNHRARNRRLTTPTRTVIQCSAYELRHEPESVMEDLIALGVPCSRVPRSP
jgi:hypothetical protein